MKSGGGQLAYYAASEAAIRIRTTYLFYVLFQSL